MTVKEITGSNLLKLDDSYRIIDVRTKEEYKEGHVKNAINIPLDDIAEGNFNLDKKDKLVIYCKSNKRSSLALDILKDLGYENLSLAPGVDLFDYKLVN